ncbi:hypothetical protein [Halomonas elongata]|uniref:hypothetical protein n=1 Tax=Halomonas elongata TaxID=2746 RepID=UPI003DA75584
MPHSRHIDQLQQQAANSLSLHKAGIHPPPHSTATMTTSSTHGSLPLDVRNNPKRFGDTEVLKSLPLQARHHPHRPSGSGKSAFLRCMNLLKQPNEGKPIAHGEPIPSHRIEY